MIELPGRSSKYRLDSYLATVPPSITRTRDPAPYSCPYHIVFSYSSSRGGLSAPGQSVRGVSTRNYGVLK